MTWWSSCERNGSQSILWARVFLSHDVFCSTTSIRAKPCVRRVEYWFVIPFWNIFLQNYRCPFVPHADDEKSSSLTDNIYYSYPLRSNSAWPVSFTFSQCQLHTKWWSKILKGSRVRKSSESNWLKVLLLARVDDWPRWRCYMFLNRGLKNGENFRDGSKENWLWMVVVVVGPDSKVNKHRHEAERESKQRPFLWIEIFHVSWTRWSSLNFWTIA